MADIKLGLNTEAFRHADKPLDYCLEAISGQGYRYCELNMLNGRDLLCEAGYYSAVSMERDPLEVRDVVKSFGLKVSGVSAHCPMACPEISVPFLTRAVEFADGLGATCVCTDEGVVPDWMTDKQAFELIRYTLQRVLPVAERHKVHIALEPHQKFSVRLDTYQKILGLVDSPYLSANPDTGNVYMSGGDPYEFLEAVAERIVHVHAKDIGGVVTDERGKVTGVPSGCACGAGVLDWDRILKILRKAGFKGVLSVECSTEEEGADSLNFLRKVLRKKGKKKSKK
ncbi:MAG: sugar phosphate isomerase/epimerase family protein [Planctomycetota bacterium]